MWSDAHRGIRHASRVVAIIGLVALPVATGAQRVISGQSEGSITGVVTGSSGASLSGVTVTVRNTDSGNEWRTATDTQGRYVFTGLGPGLHRLTFSAAGFTSRDYEVVLGAGGRVDVPIMLESATGASVRRGTTARLSPQLSAEWTWRTAETRAELPPEPPRTEFTLSPIGGASLKVGGEWRWSYDVGTRAAVGLPSESNTGMAVVKPLPELEDWIEVTTAEERADPKRQNRVPLRDDGSGGAYLTAAFMQIMPRFAITTLYRAQGKRLDAAGVREPLSDEQVEDKEQSQVATPQPKAPDPNSLRQYTLDDDYIIDVTDATPMRQAPWANGLPGMLRQLLEPTLHASSQASGGPGVPRPSLKVFLRSLGRSTGENAVQATFINDGNVPIRLAANQVFVMEPLTGVSQQDLERELRRFAGRKRVTMNLAAYCLDFRKAPPTAGRIYRVAALPAQESADPIRRVLLASERLQQWGELHPDGDPNEYFHSIRQWAIWTREQRFNEQSFGQALLEHTKKNVTAAGRKWDKQIETAARSLIPNRWRDVQHVLAESQRFLPSSTR